MAKILDFRGNPITESTGPGIDKDGNTVIPDKAAYHVYGVQVWEKRICTGTALYSKMVDARRVAELLNKKYAELGVDHEAKIMVYPVY